MPGRIREWARYLKEMTLHSVKCRKRTKIVCSVFRIRDRRIPRSVADHLTIFQCDNSFSEMVIPVVMSYDKHGFMSGCEVGQHIHVEEILEVRVLISRPFVKYVNRTVFQKSRKQRQSLALSLRQIRCRELAFFDLNLVSQLKPLEIF